MLKENGHEKEIAENIAEIGATIRKKVGEKYVEDKLAELEKK
jgi:hypothetical protein